MKIFFTIFSGEKVKLSLKSEEVSKFLAIVELILICKSSFGDFLVVKSMSEHEMLSQGGWILCENVGS